jgi:hypothetical protein
MMKEDEKPLDFYVSLELRCSVRSSKEVRLVIMQDLLFVVSIKMNQAWYGNL